MRKKKKEDRSEEELLQLLNFMITAALSNFTDQQVTGYIQQHGSVIAFLEEDPRRVEGLEDILSRFPDKEIIKFREAMRSEKLLRQYLTDPRGLRSFRPSLRNIFLHYNGGFEWLKKQLRDLAEHQVFQVKAKLEAELSVDDEIEKELEIS